MARKNFETGAIEIILPDGRPNSFDRRRGGNAFRPYSLRADGQQKAWGVPAERRQRRRATIDEKRGRLIDLDA